MGYDPVKDIEFKEQLITSLKPIVEMEIVSEVSFTPIRKNLNSAVELSKNLQDANALSNLLMTLLNTKVAEEGLEAFQKNLENAIEVAKKFKGADEVIRHLKEAKASMGLLEQTYDFKKHIRVLVLNDLSQKPGQDTARFEECYHKINMFSRMFQNVHPLFIQTVKTILENPDYNQYINSTIVTETVNNILNLLIKTTTNKPDIMTEFQKGFRKLVQDMKVKKDAGKLKLEEAFKLFTSINTLCDPEPERKKLLEQLNAAVAQKKDPSKLGVALAVLNQFETHHASDLAYKDYLRRLLIDMSKVTALHAISADAQREKYEASNKSTNDVHQNYKIRAEKSAQELLAEKQESIAKAQLLAEEKAMLVREKEVLVKELEEASEQVSYWKEQSQMKSESEMPDGSKKPKSVAGPNTKKKDKELLQRHVSPLRLQCIEQLITFMNNLSEIKQSRAVASLIVALMKAPETEGTTRAFLANDKHRTGFSGCFKDDPTIQKMALETYDLIRQLTENQNLSDKIPNPGRDVKKKWEDFARIFMDRPEKNNALITCLGLGGNSKTPYIDFWNLSKGIQVPSKSAVAKAPLAASAQPPQVEATATAPGMGPK